MMKIWITATQMLSEKKLLFHHATVTIVDANVNDYYRCKNINNKRLSLHTITIVRKTNFMSHQTIVVLPSLTKKNVCTVW